MTRRQEIVVALLGALMLVLGLSLILPGPARTAEVTGNATYYCRPGEEGTTNCTIGHGPEDLVAAIDRKDTPWDKGDRVTVSYEGRSITVRIVDVCGCRGARVIDLTSGAFARLTGRNHDTIDELGVARGVRLSGGGPGPTLPPTDTE